MTLYITQVYYLILLKLAGAGDEHENAGNNEPSENRRRAKKVYYKGHIRTIGRSNNALECMWDVLYVVFN